MSDDQVFAGGLDDGDRELLEVVDRNDALHLRQQPSEQAEVAAADANDGPYDLWRRRPRKGAHAQSGPVLLQQVLRFHRSQRPELMDKADARVELRVSRDALFNPGHADQHHIESARLSGLALVSVLVSNAWVYRESLSFRTTQNTHVLGSSAAQVTLVEFADFQCPACGLEQPILQKLLEPVITL